MSESLSRKISILAPTRERPELLQLHWNKLISRASHPDNIELWLYIDDDDSKTIDTYQVMREKNPNINAVIGDRLWPFGKVYNILWKKSKGDIYFYWGDDYNLQTDMWDSMVLDAFDTFEDKIVLIFGDDGNPTKKGNIATCGFLHKNWVNTLGYFFPPGLERCADTWLTKISKNIKRYVFLDNFKTTHERYLTRNNEVHDEDWALDRKLRHKASRLIRKSKNKKARKQDELKLQNFIEQFDSGKNLYEKK